MAMNIRKALLQNAEQGNSYQLWQPINSLVGQLQFHFDPFRKFIRVPASRRREPNLV